MIKPLLFGSMLVAGLSGCVAPNEWNVDHSPISLEERFYQVAFYDEEYDREWRLFRRSSDLKLNIDGGTQADRAKIRALSDQITEATGLRVYEASSLADANVTIRFLNAGEWRAFKNNELERMFESGFNNIAFDFDCIVSFKGTGGADPWTVIRIPDSHRGLRRDSCIAQELAHVTGLTFDTNDRSDTVFGGWAGADRLTEVDYQLLRILFDPRLESGMTWAEAQPIVAQIIAEIETAQAP